MNELKSSRLSWLIAFGVFGLGALLSGAGYAGLRRAEELRLREINQRRIQNQLATLQSTLHHYEDSLDSLRTLLEFSESVSRSAFGGGASRLLKRFPILQAVEWIPLVAGADRAKVEAMVRAEGFSDFTFRDRVSAAPLRYETSRVAAEYVAVLYAEPLATNRPALGFNLLSGASAPQLARARATGHTSMSQRVQLLITTDSVPGFGVMLPVFATGNSSGGLAPGAFRGVVLGIFRLDNFLREAKSLPGIREMFDLLVIDRTVPETPETLGLVRFDHTVQLDVPATPAQFALPEAIHETLSIWGRTWELIYHPNPVRMDAQRTQQPLAVLALGLVASVALGLFSFARVHRAALIEQQVTERTAELHQTQTLLLEETAGRQRVEAERWQVFERITDAFVALDKDWCYTFVNEKAAQMFDRRAKDLIGKHIWTEFPEGVGQKFHLAYGKAMADQQPVFLEEYYPPYDRWFENRIYPSREGLTIYFHDITGRKKDAALLNGQKHVLELIATGAPLPETLTALVRLIEAQSPEMLCTVLLLDADGVHVRHGAAPSLPVEFARAIDGQAIGPSAGSCGTAAFRREPVVVEDIATDPLWVDYREGALAHGLRACWSTPIFDAAHGVLGTFAIYYRQPGRPTAPHQRLIEIATQTAAIAIEQHRSATALHESEERFRQVVENLNEVFWMTNVEKSQMLYISPAYEKIWGRTCESIYQSPRNWVETIYPEDREAVVAAMLTKQIRGDYNETYRIVRPDGSIRWIHDRAYPIQDHLGRVYRVAGTAEDITEHRELEAQFQQAQKMEAIGTLAGGIAHDFNNILGGIIGYAELTKMKLKDNPAAGEYMSSLLQGAHRAAALVKQILAFSRQHEQQRSLVQLRHLVAESLNLLRATIPSTIAFETLLAGDLPAVLADATQIHQVVMNLCTNAWHAMKDRPGRLEVRLDRFDVDDHLAKTNPSLRPGPYVRLTVSDTGCGMDRATMERIFEPFFTTKGPDEGTGLGLSAVHGIMKSHDGAITVYSQPGEGTTFHAYFPAQEAEAKAVDAQAGEVPRGRGERVLFVDDEKQLALLGRAMLKELGYVVTICTSPVEALAIAKAEPAKFALVIADLTMPVMTGAELARQLLQIRPDLPVILTTGYNASFTPDRVKALGIRELLRKPYTLRSIGSAVHRVLTKSTPN